MITPGSQAWVMALIRKRSLLFALKKYFQPEAYVPYEWESDTIILTYKNKFIQLGV